MKVECIDCDLNQAKKVCQILNLNKKMENQVINLAKKELERCNMSLTNPEIMGDLWLKITGFINNDNPYKFIKKEFNDLVLLLENEIRKSIDSFETILNITIGSNLIDFAAKHYFDRETVKNLLLRNKELNLAIDHSKELKDKIMQSQSLLYIGDNCGEIVCDKIFIEYIQEMNPNLTVTYVVRGQPIVNDVTREDACYVGMDKVANIIDNGSYTLGTVLQKTNKIFKKKFFESDLVICKGQGNYEGLFNEKKENLFFLFMVKCEIVSHQLGVDTMSIVCMKNNV